MTGSLVVVEYTRRYSTSRADRVSTAGCAATRFEAMGYGALGNDLRRAVGSGLFHVEMFRLDTRLCRPGGAALDGVGAG